MLLCAETRDLSQWLGFLQSTSVANLQEDRWLWSGKYRKVYKVWVQQPSVIAIPVLVLPPPTDPASAAHGKYTSSPFYLFQDRGGCHIIPGENTFEIKVVSKTYNCFYQRWDLERQRSGGYEKYAEHGYKTCVHSRKWKYSGRNYNFVSHVH